MKLQFCLKVNSLNLIPTGVFPEEHQNRHKLSEQLFGRVCEPHCYVSTFLKVAREIMMSTPGTHDAIEEDSCLEYIPEEFFAFFRKKYVMGFISECCTKEAIIRTRKNPEFLLFWDFNVKKYLTAFLRGDPADIPWLRIELWLLIFLYRDVKIDFARYVQMKLLTVILHQIGLYQDKQLCILFKRQYLPDKDTWLVRNTTYPFKQDPPVLYTHLAYLEPEFPQIEDSVSEESGDDEEKKE